MSGGFLSDMNARVRANLGMRKRGGYFRDAKEEFVNQRKYAKGRTHKEPTPEEIQRIEKRAAALAEADRKQVRRNNWITLILFVVVVAAIISLLYLFLA
jgi:hypothetical protein